VGTSHVSDIRHLSVAMQRLVDLISIAVTAPVLLRSNVLLVAMWEVPTNYYVTRHTIVYKERTNGRVFSQRHILCPDAF
jgi:hypothetical protein